MPERRIEPLRASSFPADDPVPWWLWPQVLSLDAPLIAVLWGAALAKSHFLHLPAAFLYVLGFVTWLIYLVDRVADGEQECLPVSARHRFCQFHRRKIWALIAVVGAWVIWQGLNCLPAGLIGQGMVIAMLTALYLAVFAAPRQPWLYRCLILLALGLALLFVSRLPGADEAAKWWRVGSAVAVVLVFSRLLFSRSREPGFMQAFKEPLAALLFTLGCSVGVHFWTPPEHGVLCDETWLLWGLFTLNMWGISAAERFRVRPGLALPVDQTALAALLVLIAEGMKPADLSSRTVVECVQLSSLLLGMLPWWVRRLSPSLYHVLADVALVLPLGWLFWRL